MKVKSYIIENREEFINQLEKELCQQGISYVKIGCEFHFLDYIIRFYDFEIDRYMIINTFFVKEEQKRMKQLEEALSIVELEEKNFRKYNSNDFIVELNYRNINSYQPSYKKRTKFDQKQESIKVNQKLRRYSK